MDTSPLGNTSGHICWKHQLLCQGGLATSLYLATTVRWKRAPIIHPDLAFDAKQASWGPPGSSSASDLNDLHVSTSAEVTMLAGTFRHGTMPDGWFWLLFTGNSQSRTCRSVILFCCVRADVSLNSPSYLWDGTINLIKFLSPCKNVYMYAHLGNTLLITRLLNMDSELLLLLLFF